MKLEFDVPKGYEALFKEVVNEMIKKVTTWPQIGDKYYYISDWDIEEEEFDDDGYDSRLQSIGNMFKTKEEAEFKREQLKVLHELEELADDDQIDAYKNYHYMLIYDFDKSAVKIDDIVCAGFMYGTHYFKTKESAQAAINKIGEERLKKYYFCVPENK